MAGTTLPTPLYPRYREVYGFSELTITVIFATYAAGVLAALLIAGGWSDRIGRRRTLAPGLACSALSAVAFLLAHGLPALLAGRFLSGLSAGIFTGAATAAVVDLAPPQDRARGTLIATVANMGGLGLGPLLAGVLVDLGASPLRGPFLVHLALLVPAALVVWLMPETVERRGGPLRVVRPSVPEDLRGLFLRTGLAGFAGFAVLGLFTSVAPAFLGESLGVDDAAVVGAVVFALFMASTAGQVAEERVGEDRALVIGCAALVAGMLVLALSLAVSSLPLLVAAALIAGAGQGLTFRGGLAALTAAASPERRGEIASTFFVVAYTAISLPVIGVGVLAVTAGLETAGLVFAALVAMIGAVVLGLLARERPQPATT